MTDAASTTAAAALRGGQLVHARGREWVVLPDSEPDFLVLRPLGGGRRHRRRPPTLETVTEATFPLPTVDDLGDAASAACCARPCASGSAHPPARSVRSGNLAVEPRAYQYVPLMLALRQETVRLLIADDVGIGKTVEAGLGRDRSC